MKPLNLAKPYAKLRILLSFACESKSVKFFRVNASGGFLASLSRRG